jgi:4-alpha-glucanotransferase
VIASAEECACLEAARAALGIRSLAFGIHDAAFPAADDEDVGRGSPYAREARRLLEWARAIGFDAVQLGPQGETAAADASPYDAAVFARSSLSIAATRLIEDRWGRLVDPDRVAALLAAREVGPAGRTLPREAERLQRLLLDEAWSRFSARRGEPSLVPLAQALASFEERARGWLERDALYEALRTEYGNRPWASWDRIDADLCTPAASPQAARRRRELEAKQAGTIACFRFEQGLAHAQHEELREFATRLGLRLFADAQIGLAERDRWAHHRSFVPGYRLGAPPSRTNPEGQPWDYPVLSAEEPALAEGGPGWGSARGLVAERMDKLYAEFDAVRLDHPHGYVCPWIYRAEPADRGAALRAGARLRASPGLPDHPELERFAIAEPAQLDRSVARWADEWVTGLRPEQVERYAVLFDAIVDSARRAGRGTDAILCEVLSTEPLPLRLVRERHGLGRFRVTQKAALSDPGDVYRIENARPEDWVMVGTHDTYPIWLLVEEWSEGRRAEEAAHLAARLEREPVRRERVREKLARHPGLLAQAKLAELLLGPARQVMIYFTDALGLRDPYNVPGSGCASNWTLRLPSRWLADWCARLAAERALDLPLAFALALRARGGDPGLVARLGAHAARLRGGTPALLDPVPDRGPVSPT